MWCEHLTKNQNWAQKVRKFVFGDYFFVVTMPLGNKSYTVGKPDYFPCLCGMSSRVEYVCLPHERFAVSTKHKCPYMTISFSYYLNFDAITSIPSPVNPPGTFFCFLALFLWTSVFYITPVFSSAVPNILSLSFLFSFHLDYFASFSLHSPSGLITSFFSSST